MSDENPLRIASELARAGNPAQAVACLESALARTRAAPERPLNASILARTAGLHCEGLGRFEEAARYYEEAAATAVHDPLPLLALGEVRWRLGESAMAQSCLTSAESLARTAGDVDVLKMIATLRATWTSEHP
ncbi:tetratricopeptide repeat protein [Myxococcus dinghuensis]|uniref:tetratricopeptide repeat protein n=1 Tax=Myxococcus dinghuensis TaxID=2906761 RepID=UPI003899589C